MFYNISPCSAYVFMLLLCCE